MMQAFGFEPSSWPPDWMFAEKATVKQLEWLGKIRERENYTGIGFKMVCKAIIEEYGVPWAMSKGTASVLIDFFGGAKSSHIDKAEQKAWLGKVTI